MKLLLLSFVLTYASAATIGSGCGWGPPYWCSSLDNARECQATKHCLDTVWKHKILEQQSTETCTYCQLVIGELKDLLADKTTEDEIASLAAKACSLLSDQDWQNQCKGIILEYTPELLEMLNNDFSTSTICATVGLCKGLEDRVSPYGVKSLVPSSPTAENSTCQDCTKFFQDVQQSVTSKETINELLQLLNQSICSRLNGFEQLCMTFFRDNLPAALQVLADQVDPSEVCRIFGFCTTQMNQVRFPLKNIFKENRKGALQYRGSEECDACKEVMDQLDGVIRDRTTQQKIMDEVETVVCGEFGGLQATCKQLVEEYAPMAFEYLVNFFDPSTFCETIGMCPVPTLYGQVKPAIEKKPQAEVMTGYVQESELCIICETVMQELDNLIQENKTVVTVEEFIDKICNKLSSEDLQKQCTAFVQEYGQLVLSYVAQSLNPKTICTKLTLCKSGVHKDTVKLGDEVCDACVFAITELENLVKNKSTDEIVNDLEQVCNYLPVTEWKGTCNQYVKQYGILVIELLKDGTNPRSVCALVKACNSTHAEQLAGKMTVPIPEDLNTDDIKKPVKTGASEVCEVCNTVAYYMEILLKQNYTGEEIISALKDICSELGSLKDECNALVDQYGQNIIAFLKQELEPKVICVELGLCNENRKVASVIPVLIQPIPEQSKSQVPCEVCTEAISVLKDLIGNQVTREGIASGLELLCNKLPPNMQGDCDKLVVDYEPQIIDYILKKLGSGEICGELGLCSVKQLFSSLLSPMNMLPLQPMQPVQKISANPLECEACKVMMTTLLGLIKDKKSEEEIKKALDKVCGLLPMTMTSKCKKIVNKYEDEIIKMIIKDLGAKEICKAIGLCDAAVVKLLPKPIHVKVLQNEQANPLECEACKVMMTTLLGLIKDKKSEEEIKKALDKVCGLLPMTMTSTCKKIVDKYEDEIIKMIIKDLGAKEICKAIGLCDAAVVKLLPKPIHVKVLQNEQANPLECEACKVMMTTLLGLIKDKKSEEEIKKALDKVCDLLPMTMTSKCKEIVDQYEDEIIKMIINDFSAKEICKAIGLCDAAMVKLLPKPIHVKVLQNEQAENPIECEGCKLVMNYVIKYIGDDKSEEKIQEALDKVCHKMPKYVSDVCEVIVSKYTKEIINYILMNLGADEICEQLGLCSAAFVQLQSKPIRIEVLKNEQAVSSKAKGGVTGPECVLCEYILQALDQYLQGNSSKEAIETALDEVCGLLPSTISAECKQFVDQYAPQILQLLIDEVDPKTICTTIGLCSSAAQSTLKAGPTCVVCEIVLKTLDEFLAKKSSQAEIEKALDLVCSMIPTDITTECKKFVDEYASLIISLLVQEVKPDQICKEIKLCTQQKIKSPLECEACKTVCNSIETWLHQNKSKDEIIGLLYSLCEELPDTVTVQCKSEMDMVAPKIMQLLQNYMDPDLVCPTLQLCTSKPMPVKTGAKETDGTLYFHPKSHHQKMLGTNKCMWGPAYWCASKENAVSCNAVEHCKRHAWN